MSHPLDLSAIEQLNERIVSCRNCPRLVKWREDVARDKRAAYIHETYWGKPVPNFGDPTSRRLIVGLAPAAHGGNRTGRLFTGDRSGDWLFRALHKAGLANQPESVHSNDGLIVTGAYLTPIVHCAPPLNKPTLEETRTCSAYLVELLSFANFEVFLCLGSLAWNELHRILGASPPKFGHMALSAVVPGQIIIGCYHPSQQNTFTGKLTEDMLDAAIELFRTTPLPSEAARSQDTLA